MLRFKFPWLCKIFGHRFILINDLRESAVKRHRVVYRCSRCSSPMIERLVTLSNKEQRQAERRRNAQGQDDRRKSERRRTYTPHYDVSNLLHG